MERSIYKVTIGIPVYNVENYIKATLTSALEQDLDGIEILVVDDCGSDHSIDIVAELQVANPNGKNIHIIHHTENQGAAGGRNTIIKNAQGKYIFFLDSDDLIDKTAISTLYNAAEKNNAEVTYGSMMACDQNNNKEPFSILPSKILEGEDALINYIYSDIRNNITASSCNILFLTDFLRKNNLQFPKYKVGEDVLFNDEIHPLVRKAVLLPDITYYYMKRPNSLMRYQVRDTISVEEIRGSLLFAERKKELCQKAYDKPYYGGKCAKIMKGIFYNACGIIGHRHQLTDNISDKEIRDCMTHPAHLWEILHFKQLRGTNIVFWLLGVLPPKLSVIIMEYIGKKKGYIRIHKK